MVIVMNSPPSQCDETGCDDAAEHVVQFSDSRGTRYVCWQHAKAAYHGDRKAVAIVLLDDSPDVELLTDGGQSDHYE